ncbi:MAG: hypothetical protein ACRDSP_18030 [Pseudonocardiaceae bacterium]
MTDFVDRLLGRSGAPPIRPVVPSLFEPFAPAVAEPPLPMGTVSESAHDPQGHDRQGHDPQGTVSSTQAGPPMATPALSASTVPSFVPPAGAPIESPLPMGAFSDSARGPHRVAVPSSSDPAVPVTARASAAHPPPPRIEPIRDIAETVARQLGVPVEHRVTASRTAVAAPRGGHPVAPRYQPVTSPARAAARREAAAGPDVHISIGRVEVRAVAEPVAPPRKEQRTQPVLSLDDYLRSKAGGDRR